MAKQDVFGPSIPCMHWLRHILTLLSCCLPMALTASEGMGWRGDGSGVYPTATPPLHWNGETGQHIKWRAALPARGTASVIGTDQSILVLCEPDLCLCLDRHSGQEQWRRHYSAADFHAQPAQWRTQFHAAWLQFNNHQPHTVSGKALKKQGKAVIDSNNKRWRVLQKQVGIKAPVWRESGYWAASPASSGDHIILRHGTDYLTCINWQGQTRWRARPNNYKRKGGYGGDLWAIASPLIIGDLVIVTWNPPPSISGNSKPQVFESLVAFNLSDGSERWRSQACIRTAGWLCASPAHMQLDGKDVIITGGGGVFDATTGALLARDTGWSGSASSPVVSGNIALFLEITSHTNGKPKAQIIPPGSRVYAVAYTWTDGQLQHRRLWQYSCAYERRSFVSPLIHNKRAYIGGDWNMVFDLQSGQLLFGPVGMDADAKSARAWGKGKQRAPFGIGGLGRYPSLLATASHIFVPMADGSMRVVEAGAQAKLVATNTLTAASKQEFLISTPSLIDNELYIRTDQALYCISNTP